MALQFGVYFLALHFVLKAILHKFPSPWKASPNFKLLAMGRRVIRPTHFVGYCYDLLRNESSFLSPLFTSTCNWTFGLTNVSSS
jgi:hypothetical protein